MGDVINLNQHRKTRQRREQSRVAQESRARSGRGKGERAREAFEAERAEERHELLKLERDPPPLVPEEDEPTG